MTKKVIIAILLIAAIFSTVFFYKDSFEIVLITGIILCILIINYAFLKYQVKIKTDGFIEEKNTLEKEIEKIRVIKQALLKGEQQYRRVFDTATECIAIHQFIYDDHGVPYDYMITDANTSYLETLNLKRDDIIGKKSVDVFQVDSPPFISIFLETNKTGRSQRFETYVEGLDKHFSVQVFQPYKDQFVAVCEDITERKNSENTIRASEEKYRLLVENAHDAIMVFQDNCLKYSNPRALHLLNAKGLDIAGLAMTDLIHPDDRERVLNAHAQRIAGADVPNNYTFRGINCDGDILWLQLNAVLFEWEGKPSILCIIRDISDEKKLEDQLIQSQKMEAIGTLAGGIAHDFNNILSAIIGYTELCLLDVPRDGKAAGRLKHVFKAGQRAKALTGQILNFSKQKDKELKPVKIRLIVDEALKLIRATVPSTIRIETSFSKDTGIITGDTTQIHQVVMNLCTNAYHAMEEAGGTLTVNIQNITIDKETSKYLVNITPGKFVQLQISDTGHGMNKEIVKRVFDPYFTTKKTGKGTGLGLAVVHGIVQSMNGGIKVTSEPEKGTTFDIYLPITEIQETVMEGPLAPDPTGTEKILVVDDEEVLVEMTSDMLQSLGYQVTTRVNAIEALKVFSNNPDRFDLVVTDQTMPQKTGRELAEELLKLRPNLPIILCTGFSTSINEESARTIGIGAFLNKPVLKSQLAQSVRRLLDETKKNSTS